jgi:hypothetical protein
MSSFDLEFKTFCEKLVLLLQSAPALCFCTLRLQC